MRAAARCLSVAIAVGWMTIACSTIRPPHIDYAPNVDFGKYQTFTWISDDPLIRPSGKSDPFVSPLDLQRIERAIESELTAKGFRQLADSDQADFVVSFTVGTRDKIDAASYPTYYHDGWSSSWPYWDGVEVHTYTEGVLAIDIFDRAQREPVWHGVARKRISGTDIENSGELIKAGVAAILKRFPPQRMSAE